MAQIRMHRPAKSAQHFEEESRGRDPVHIAVAEYYQRLFFGVSLEETVNSDCHIRQEKGIGQMLEARFEVIADGSWFGETTVNKALGKQWRNLQILRQTASEQW